MEVKMKRTILLSVILLAGMILFACTTKDIAVEKQEAPKAALQESRESQKAAWEIEWEKATSLGRREGRIVLYTTWRPETRQEIANAMKSKYGIEIEYVMGRGADIAEKLLRERKAGIYNADMYSGGSTTLATQLKPAGILMPVEPYLILPEVKDPKVWVNGRLNFVDKDRLIFYFTLFATGYDNFHVNSDLVKKGEIKSWKDLLEPKWKGKIVMNDPTVAGRGNQLFSVAHEVLGADYWIKFAQQLPAITRDQRLQVEWVAKGKYAIMMAGITEIVADFQRAGAPIVPLNLPEVNYLSLDSSGIVLPSNPAHPNALKVFLNWLLNKEGQTLWTKSTAYQSARLDVTTEYVDPLSIRRSEINYFQPENEEFLLQRPKFVKIAQEIFEPLLK